MPHQQRRTTPSTMSPSTTTTTTTILNKKILKLPKEVLLRIMAHVPLIDLWCRVPLVCRAWHLVQPEALQARRRLHLLPHPIVAGDRYLRDLLPELQRRPRVRTNRAGQRRVRRQPPPQRRYQILNHCHLQEWALDPRQGAPSLRLVGTSSSALPPIPPERWDTLPLPRRAATVKRNPLLKGNTTNNVKRLLERLPNITELTVQVMEPHLTEVADAVAVLQSTTELVQGWAPRLSVLRLHLNRDRGPDDHKSNDAIVRWSEQLMVAVNACTQLRMLQLCLGPLQPRLSVPLSEKILSHLHLLCLSCCWAPNWESLTSGYQRDESCLNLMVDMHDVDDKDDENQANDSTRNRLRSSDLVILHTAGTLVDRLPPRAWPLSSLISPRVRCLSLGARFTPSPDLAFHLSQFDHLHTLYVNLFYQPLMTVLPLLVAAQLPKLVHLALTHLVPCNWEAEQVPVDFALPQIRSLTLHYPQLKSHLDVDRLRLDRCFPGLRHLRLIDWHHRDEACGQCALPYALNEAQCPCRLKDGLLRRLMDCHELTTIRLDELCFRLSVTK